MAAVFVIMSTFNGKIARNRGGLEDQRRFMVKSWSSILRTVWLATMALASHGPGQCSAASQAGMNLLSQGNALYCSGQFTSARDDYLQAIATDTTYAPAFSDLGLAYAHLGSFSLAISNLQAATMLDTNTKAYWLNLGKAQAMNGQYQGAITSFTRAIALDASYKEAYYNSGWCYDALNNYTPAITNYQQAINLDNRYGKALLGMAIAKARTGQTNEAVWWCKRAIQATMGTSNAGEINALAHQNLRTLRGDDFLFTQSNSASTFTSALSELVRERFSEATNDFARLARSETNSALAHYMYARAQLATTTADSNRVGLVSAELQTALALLPAATFASTPSNQPLYLDYQPRGLTTTTSRLFPATYDVAVPFPPYYASAPARVTAGTQNTFSYDVASTNSLNIAKLIAGGGTYNVLVGNQPLRIQLPALLKALELAEFSILSRSNLQAQSLDLLNPTGFYLGEGNIISATLASVSPNIAMTKGSASSRPGDDYFEFTPGPNLPAAPSATDTNFLVIWTSSFGAGSFELRVLPPTSGQAPLVVEQPADLVVAGGAAFNLTVTATGSPWLRFQWYKDGLPVFNSFQVRGATNYSLTISNAQATDSGLYTVAVRNAFGADVSRPAVVSVMAPPVILVPPQSLAAEVDSTVRFQVQAAGSGPLSYQWRKGGIGLSDGGRYAGSTSNILTITAIQAGEGGVYTVTVSNPYGSAASDGTTLVVLPAGDGITITSTNGWNGLTSRYPFGEDNTATYGQTFVAPTAARLRNVTLFLSPSNDPGPVDFKLCVMAWDGVKATGAVLYTSQATNTAHGLGMRAFSFQSAGVSLRPGATYVAFLSAQFDGIIGHAAVGAIASGYPAGNFVYLDNGGDFARLTNGAWNSVSDLDLAFSATFEGPRVPPGLDLQPVARAVLPGSTAVFAVVASGTEPLSYQWQKDGVNLAEGGRVAGATGAALTLNSAGAGEVGEYRVVITNSFGTITSSAAALTLRAATGIGPDAYGYRASDVACEFEDISATGNQVLVGADDAVATVGVGFDFSFYGVNFSTVVISANGLLAFGQPNDQPDNVNLTTRAPLVNVPHIAPFWSDLITGRAGIYYQTLGTPSDRRLIVQWQDVSGYSSSTFDHRSSNAISFEVELFEKTGDILVQYGNLETGDARTRGGQATVGLRDTSGQENGRALQWTYNQPNLFNGQAIRFYLSSTAVPPSISLQPTGQVVLLGATASLAVLANGPSPLSYQWSKDGTALSGATVPSLVLSNVQLADIGTYAVVVSNPNGSIASLPASLFVVEGPRLLIPPRSQTNVAGTAATFSVVVLGSSPMDAQWRKNGTNLVGVTGTQFLLSNVQPGDAGDYSVVLANPYGSITSAVATLTVAQLPSLLKQPLSQKALAGDEVVFSVSAAGTPPFAYQWLKNGNSLSAGSPDLVLESVQTADAAGYSAVVANAYGSVTSTVATLAVRVATQVGPDAYGYMAKDNWPAPFEDISTNGTRLLVEADDWATNAALGFKFVFYGVSFSNVFISANGLLTFTDPNTQNLNVNLSNSAPEVNVPHVAPFWTDLVTGTNGVYCQTLGTPGNRRFVVLWKDVHGFDSPNSMTFEATLYEGGNDLVFQYLNVDSGDARAKGARSTVAIRDINGQTSGRVLQWSCNQPVLQNGQAIHFFLPGPPVPLRFEHVELTNGIVFLKWTGTIGRVNRLKASASLHSPQWDPVASGINMTGTVTLSLTNNAGRNQWFFRLEEQ